MAKDGLVIDNSDLGGICSRSKDEVSGKALHSRRCKLAFMSALFVTSGSILIHGDSVSVAVATRYPSITEAVREVTEDLTGRTCRVERGGGRYTEIIVDNALMLLRNCKVLDFGESGITVCDGISQDFRSEQSVAVAYLRGAYLGSGSLSLKNKYHLEFCFSRRSVASDFAEMLASMGIGARLTSRGDKTVAYIKDSQEISDCLALMGAGKAVLDFNDLTVRRQMSGHINRQRNCDMHNIDKQVETGLRQCEAIRNLDIDALSPTLRDTARARLENPDMKIEELGRILGVTKSGVKNRLRRLEEIYRKNSEEH